MIPAKPCGFVEAKVPQSTERQQDRDRLSGANRSAPEPRPDELDPIVLVWWLRKRLDTSHLRNRRSVLHVRFDDVPERFWIVTEHCDPSVRLTDPGCPVDLSIRSDLVTLYLVSSGRIQVLDTQRGGSVTFDGPSALVRRLPQILRLSPVAEQVATNRVGAPTPSTPTADSMPA